MTEISNKDLIAQALAARQHAYVPYSSYPVGAALLTKSGKVYTGVNVENAAYPVTMCAERVAVFKAISEGEMDFQAMAVVTNNGGTACGSCRQVLNEFAPDIPLLFADKTGKLVTKMTVAELLPESFSPQDLDV